MNWSRAKSILIIALLVADLFIGSYYLSNVLKDRREAQLRSEDAIRYLEQKGVAVEAKLPETPGSLPALTLQFSNGELTHPGPAHAQFDRIPIVIYGQEDSAGFTIEAGDAVIEIAPAYSALLRAAAQLAEDGAKTVDTVELVYYVAESNVVDASEDTALPYWAIYTDIGEYYYPAYQE